MKENDERGQADEDQRQKMEKSQMTELVASAIYCLVDLVVLVLLLS